MQDIKGRALRGGLAKLFGQGGKLALRLAFTVVVARLLSPEDFGLVAMVTVVTAVLNLFAGAGLSQSTVQRSRIDNQQISTLFWINILVGLILSLLCLVLAPLIVAVYSEPRLFWVTVAIGMGFFIGSAGVQHLALLERKLRYVTLAALEFVSQLVGISIGIYAAIAGYGYWALVASMVGASATLTMGAWIVTRWIPAWPKFKADILSLVHFGGTVTMNAMASYFAYNFDKFIIGRVLGAATLGPYALASQLINVPVYNTHTAIGGLVFSVLSRLQDDPVRFRNYFLKAYALVVSLTLPITIFLGVFSEDVVSVVLGPKWAAAAATFLLLSPSVLVLGFVAPLEWFLWSSGRHTRSLRIALVLSALAIIGCIAGLPYGTQGVAIGFSTALTLWLCPHVVWALHGTTVTPRDLLRSVSPPILAACAGVVLAFAAQPYLAPLQPVLRLALLASVMGGVYVFLLLLVLGQKAIYLDLFKTLRSRPFRGSDEPRQDVPSGDEIYSFEVK